MALAYGDFHELSHQLRFLLFEIGIGLPQRSIDYFITSAHRLCLQRLQYAAIAEGLITRAITSHHLHDFIDQLKMQLKEKQPRSMFFQWQSLRDEIDETIANEAMAQAYRQSWQIRLTKQINTHHSFWNWLCNENSAEEAMQLLEQWGCVGHPYYPNFRAKMGFSRREVLQYSPEFNAQVSLHWGALHKQWGHTSEKEKSYRELLASQFPKEYKRWQEKLAFKHFNPEEYYPVPLHPWQWRNQIQNIFSSLIDNKELVLLPHHQTTKPSMSFRTMMPLQNQACHIKLATAVHTTFAVRTVSPASIDNGPRLSLWLDNLLQKHENYQQSLFVASDLAGLNIKEGSSPSHQRKQLALILQENPSKLLKDNQRIVPLGALFVQSAVSNEPLLIEIIQASGENPLDYFRCYCRCVLSSQLHLLLCYGVALEAHQQNTLVIFGNHKPEALVIRDLGNISICEHPLYRAPLKPTFHPTIITNNLDDVRHKFVHGNLQNNLAYWIALFSQHYSFPVENLWSIVSRELQHALKRIEHEIPPEIFRLQQNRLLSAPWQHKCSLSMRLHSRKCDYLSRSVLNPLSQFHA